MAQDKQDMIDRLEALMQDWDEAGFPRYDSLLAAMEALCVLKAAEDVVGYGPREQLADHGYNGGL